MTDNLDKLLEMLTWQDRYRPLRSEEKFRLIKLPFKEFEQEIERMAKDWNNCHYVEE